MKREEGYYWVKPAEAAYWQVYHWSGERLGWHNGYARYYPDSYFTEINETRIKSPDEIGSDKYKAFTDSALGEDYTKAENPDAAGRDLPPE